MRVEITKRELRAFLSAFYGCDTIDDPEEPDRVIMYFDTDDPEGIR